jgi:hypothetical protein
VTDTSHLTPTQPSSAFHKRERVWALRLLRDALRTEQDLSLLHRRHGLALLLAFLDAALHRPTGGGVPAESLVISVGLEVISAAASLPRGPALLLRQGGLLTWAGGAVTAALQHVPAHQQQHQGGQRGRQHAAEALAKRTVTVLRSILALTVRAVQGFAAQQLAQQQQQGQPQHPGVADQARALIPSLLLLLLRGGLLPAARPRPPGAAPNRHAPAAVLALAGAVLELLLLLQRPTTGLLPAVGLGVPQALALVEALNAVAAPATVRAGLTRQVLTLIVREAAADEAWGERLPRREMDTEEENEEEEGMMGPDALARLLAWVAESTVALLHSAPSDEAVDALATSAAAGRLTLRLLQQQQQQHHPLPVATTVATALCASAPHYWPWTLVSLLSCPAFLPGSLKEVGTASARSEAKVAWLQVALHLLCVMAAGEKREEKGRMLHELMAALTDAGEAAAAAAVVVDVLGSTVRALLGKSRDADDDDAGLAKWLHRETRTALAPLVALPAWPDEEEMGACATKKRPATNKAERGSAGKKQKRNKA